MISDNKQTLQWHQIFGWTSIISPNTEIINAINNNIKYLWSKDMIEIFFSNLSQNEHVEKQIDTIDTNSISSSRFRFLNYYCQNGKNESGKKSLSYQHFSKCYDKKIDKMKDTDIISDSFVSLIYTSLLYEKLMDILPQFKLSIISSLAINYTLIRSFWHYLINFESLDVLLSKYTHLLDSSFFKALNQPANEKHFVNYSHHVFQPLILCCDITSHAIILLDDQEIFEAETLFFHPKNTLSRIAKFLNVLVYTMICQTYPCPKNNFDSETIGIAASTNREEPNPTTLIGKYKTEVRGMFSSILSKKVNNKNPSTATFISPTSDKFIVDEGFLLSEPAFTSCHALLSVLHDRDIKSHFVPSQDHWLIKEVKISSFLSRTSRRSQERDRSYLFLDYQELDTHLDPFLILEEYAESLPRGATLYKRVNGGSEEEDDKEAFYDVPPKSKILLNIMPHILSQNDRVTIFRKYLSRESNRVKRDENANYIKVRRNSILEDGYVQITKLSPLEIKGIIRVRFVNPQGLEEPGIDQDGVFKEFLEEIVKKLFEPDLNLFRVTNDHKYYPSATSFIQENHLSLFEFAGLLIGKAVYEGLVLDTIELASFFLNQIIQRGRRLVGINNQILSQRQENNAVDASSAGSSKNNAKRVGKKIKDERSENLKLLYSPVDELGAADPVLYKNLKYLKDCKENVKDLGLTFAVNVECLGKVETCELMPGGTNIAVNQENKFSYIHLMARHRLHTQIHKQVETFVKGFYSVIKPGYISIFSSTELQQIISGENRELDLHDLRKHTKYYGGFHDKHRVIVWLWDILVKEFDKQDQAKFLKFVTSCSRAPLQGFSHLEPPFAVRCVDVGDEEDNGDTIATVIQGFLSLKKQPNKLNKTRLPTASTCFNLLKLPNYSKKSILREKLKYAINSNTGFELS
ncbi:unnamed protein product [Gordionus sp. m RMFG-2023]